ncbi:MAG: PP2C family protein-serine/threonine phosphatase, partial [Bacteroidia bacterium]
PGDCLYLFSDGITDQFGGESGKKLKTSGFREWLREVSGKEMTKQKEILSDRLKKWNKEYPQTDDILLIGVKC